MRLGLFGPAGQSDEPLDRAARFVLAELSVDRAVYLGQDQALERVVSSWAEQLVGGDPSDDALWRRAAAACARAGAAEIDAFLRAERERRRLSIFESLSGHGTRSVELLDGKLAVMIYDKADLDEEDIASASFLVYGKSREPLVKQVGPRWFLSPGTLETAGVMTLEDAGPGVRMELYDSSGHRVGGEELAASRAAKLRVHGASGA